MDMQALAHEGSPGMAKKQDSRLLRSRSLWLLAWPATWLTGLLAYGVGVNVLNALTQDYSVDILLIVFLCYALVIEAIGIAQMCTSKEPAQTWLKLTGAWFPTLLGPLTMLLIYIAIPGYIVPFLNHPICRLAMLGLFGWQLIGAYLLPKVQSFSLWVGTNLLFMLPIAIFVRVGSYLITTSRATPEQLLKHLPAVADIWKLDRFLIAVALLSFTITYPRLWQRILLYFKSATRQPQKELKSCGE